MGAGRGASARTAPRMVLSVKDASPFPSRVGAQVARCRGRAGLCLGGQKSREGGREGPVGARSGGGPAVCIRSTSTVCPGHVRLQAEGCRVWSVGFRMRGQRFGVWGLGLTVDGGRLTVDGGG